MGWCGRSTPLSGRGSRGGGRRALVIEDLKHLAAVFIVKPFNPLLTEVLLDRAIERAALQRRLRKQPAEIARKVERQFSQRLETERFLVVKQIVDKLSTFIGRIAQDVQGGVRYFNEMPYFVAIHDRHGQVLAANRAYRMLLAARSATTAGRCMRAGPVRRTAHR